MRRGRPRHDDILTPREWDVVALLRQDLTNEQIATRLGISENTAKYHVAQIMAKLGVSSRQEAAAWQEESKAATPRRWGFFAPVMRLLRPPRPALAAKAAGLVLVGATGLGLILLAFGVLSMNNRASPNRALTTPMCDPRGIAEPVEATPPPDPQTSWALARSTMPADIDVYEPAPYTTAGLGMPQLMEACLGPDLTPQYTVLYQAPHGYLVFILNQSYAAAYGNTSGPPTWTATVGIHCPEHCIDGEELYTTGTSNGQWFEYYAVSWQENGYTYQVKLENEDETAKIPGQTFADVVDSLSDAEQQHGVFGPTPVRPKPNATQLAQLTEIIEHYGGNTPEPIFTGIMNGFTFQAGVPPVCPTVPPPNGAVSEHGSALLAASGLDFDATYVPDGYAPDLQTDRFGDARGHVLAGQCGDTVDLVSETWSSPSGHFSVSRRASSPVIANHYSADRLEATTIGGRPAIVVHPRFAGEEVDIYLRDHDSFWTLRSEDLSVDMLVQVAAGLQDR